jgi:polyisoprenoid-binding protein YceI
MMISRVRGWFDAFEGEFEIDEKNPGASKVNVRIEAASINTRESNRDNHLRSADFFDAETYPYLTFTSKRVEVLDNTHAKLYGSLTIRDITHDVVMDVEYTGQAKSPWGVSSLGFNGRTVINRKDWNLTWNKSLETGGMLVGDEITIDIELELKEVAVPEAVL